MSHIKHPYEDNDLSLAEANRMIKAFANAEMPVMYEKADGFNMKVTWHNNKLLFAKTKTHLSSLDNALDRDGLEKRYKGRNIQHDMLKAYDRIDETLSSLPVHALKTFFKDGRYLNVEVIGSFINVFHYTKEAIILHNFLETTGDGDTTVSDEDIGDFFHCVDRNAANHIFEPKHRVFFDRKFTSLQSDLLFSHEDLENTTIGNLKVEIWEKELANNSSHSHYFSENEDIRKRVATRLALSEKQGKCGIRSLRSDDVPEKVIEYIQDVEGAGCNYFADRRIREDIARSFEILGMYIIPNIKSMFYRKYEDKSYAKDLIVHQIGAKLEAFRKNEFDVRDTQKVMMESNFLDYRINKNLSAHVPHSEGIVFKWEGNTYKLTGLFRMLNYILGLGRHIR